MSSAASAPVSAPLGPKLGESMQQHVEQHRMIERVLADQRRGEIMRDDPERGKTTLHRRGLTDAERTVIAMDSDPGAVLLRAVAGCPADLKSLDVTNFHGRSPRELSSPSQSPTVAA